MLIYKKVIVGDQQCVLVKRRERFVRLLGPGTYRVFGWEWEISLETYHNASGRRLMPNRVRFLVKERPDMVAESFTLVETRETEVALVSLQGTSIGLIGPGKQILYFKHADITVDVFDGAHDVAVPANRLEMIERYEPEP